MHLRKFLAPELVFGVGALRLAGRYAGHFGCTRVLVVSDPGVAAAGWTQRVIDCLAAEGLTAIPFLGVSENPRIEEVAAGAQLYQLSECDGLVAVGGGSPMDCAKGIGIVVSHKRPIEEFEGVDQVLVPMPPTICIPTTAGTSSEVSQFAIFSNRQMRRKFGVIGKGVVPDLALIDPETLTTLDTHHTGCTAMDALVHAVEAFVSKGSSPITDVHALTAMRLLAGNMVASVQAPTDVELRKNVMLGSLEAGLAFSNASLGAVHAMAHSLGGLTDLPHGECNAMLLEHIVGFNFDAAPERFREIAGALDVPTAGMLAQDMKKALLRRVQELRIGCGIEASLSRRGVTRSEVPDLAANAMSDMCIVTNPRVPSRRDLEVLYEEAL